jgi:hypothetical protein
MNLTREHVLPALLYTIHSWMWGKQGHMAIKIDMSKAYGMVEWRFLEEVMVRMGFNFWWISLMMMCVQSSHYAVLVNGTSTGNIVLSRSIR